MKVALLGTSGYTGQLLLRMLMEHSEVEDIIAVSSSHSGEDIGTVDPGIGSNIYETNSRKFKLTDGKLTSIEHAAKLLPDVVIAALPHLKSAELCEPFLGKSVVIDLSADFRIKDAGVFEKAYGKRPPREDLLEKAVYGLCEWYKNEIRRADIIANPGCYPTATLLPLLPLIKERVIGNRIVTNAISGISGGGRKANINLLFVERSENTGAYAPGTSHRHQPEIVEELDRVNGRAGGERVKLLFTPHLAPLRRGIAATSWAILNRETSDDEITSIYKKYYGDSKFILFSKERIPQTQYVLGSNRCDIGWKIEGDSILLFSAIDNLVKGASGQAIQNMNIRFGLKEEEGLRLYGDV